jgi:hypothetical protein
VKVGEKSAGDDGEQENEDANQDADGEPLLGAKVTQASLGIGGVIAGAGAKAGAGFGTRLERVKDASERNPVLPLGHPIHGRDSSAVPTIRGQQKPKTEKRNSKLGKKSLEELM